MRERSNLHFRRWAATPPGVAPRDVASTSQGEAEGWRRGPDEAGARASRVEAPLDTRCVLHSATPAVARRAPASYPAPVTTPAKPPNFEHLWTEFPVLYRIAQDAARALCQPVPALDNVEEGSPLMYMSGLDEDRHVLSATVFSALTAEGFINYYAANHLHRGVCDLSERVPVVEKWRQYPGIAVGLSLDKGVLKRLRSLFDARNEIVHPKARWHATDGLQAVALRFSHQRAAAPGHVAVVAEAVRALHALDARVEVDWLESGWLPARMRERRA